MLSDNDTDTSDEIDSDDSVYDTYDGHQWDPREESDPEDCTFERALMEKQIRQEARDFWLSKQVPIRCGCLR